MKKDVIYIDIEDDITSVIAKLKASSSKIVALVPPKRATIFTSLVNLKLLKKAAGDVKKRLVIITADDSLRMLAGGLGLYVAKNLTSPPEVPENTNRPEIPSAVIQASGIERPEGINPSDDEVLPETENEPTSESAKSSAAGVATAKAAKKFKKLKPLKKDKRLPDFNSFRKRLLLGGVGLLLLLVGWWFAAFALPEAAITIETQQTRVATDFTLISSTNGSDAPETEEDNTYGISGETKTIEITQTVDVNPTGEKNIGDKADGSLEIRNCGDEFSLVSGTRFSPEDNDLIFVSTESVQVPEGDCNFFSSNPGEADVRVEAAKAGDEYNISETQYEVVSFSDSENAELQINGSKMGGGTTEIATVVQASDVERAVESISFNDDQDAILDQLAERFEGSTYLLEATLKEKTTDPDVAPRVGEEAESAKATVTRTYSVAGVAESELEDILKQAFQAQLSDQQAIVNTGIDQLLTEVVDEDDNSVTLEIKANGSAGPDIDMPALKENIAGRQFSDAESHMKELPGVISVSIELSPFWVSKIPANPEKIDIAITEPEGA